MTVSIHDWSFVHGDADPYTSQECIPTLLHGIVFGHPNPIFNDGDTINTSPIKSGDTINTSPIKSLDFENCIVRCYSRDYKLGRPNIAFLKYWKENDPKGHAEFMKHRDKYQIKDESFDKHEHVLGS